MNTESGPAIAHTKLNNFEEEEGLGTILIDVIDLKLPILEGATKQNLQHVAAHMTETAPLDYLRSAG
ncbi:hypothetical protein QNH46_11470 [Paenibacillus woosongensis]|uniref:Uncharacterized protein n=1 Tax=Paenibacillus woosongensis TaxID=307580 RepID=A0AA95IEH1_9BACL|nr:hypothetical protein [Paenibacillus woosongensis]WHX51213.1 hypothetical protein QNH46_11470 [Paenibacillus woosongensis]